MLHAAAHAGYVPKQHQQGKEQGGIERPAEEYLDALRQQVLIRYNEACAPEKGCKGGGAKAITSRKRKREIRFARKRPSGGSGAPCS